jgi:hypothetical protein
MPEAMVTLLYRTVRPLLSMNESVSLQKRAYHVLDSLLKHHGSILTVTESRMQILNLIVESLLTCQVSNGCYCYFLLTLLRIFNHLS